MSNKRNVMVFLVALVAALAIPATIARQKAEAGKLPETPAGKTFAAFLKALNSGDVEQMKQFHKDRHGDVANAEKDLEFYQRSGGIQIINVTPSGDFALEATVETKNDPARLNFSLEVDSTPPHAIVSIRVTRAAN